MKYPILKIQDVEINPKTDNFILVKGEKSTGKTLIVTDLLKQYDKPENTTIVSCTENKIYSNGTVNNISVKEFLLNLQNKIKKDKDLYDRSEQYIIYLDGFDLLNIELVELLNTILKEIRFSSYTIVVSTRHKIKNLDEPDLLIKTSVKGDYDKIKIIHQSALYITPKSVIIKKPTYSKELYLYLANLGIKF